MRPRHRRRSSKPWHFDDYDESDYILESDTQQGFDRDIALYQGTNNVVAYPKNAGIQIRVSGNITISFVGVDGIRRELFRYSK